MSDEAPAKNPVGAPTKYRPEMCETVLKSGAEGKTLAEMAEDLDIHRNTLNIWCEVHPELGAAVERALQKAQVWWESQGREGTFGNIPGYNPTSYIFQMKNRFKHDWRDRHEYDVGGELAVRPALQVEKLSDEHLRAIAAIPFDG